MAPYCHTGHRYTGGIFRQYHLSHWYETIILHITFTMLHLYYFRNVMLFLKFA